MRAKLFKMFPSFCLILLKQFVWTLDVEKFRAIMDNIAKTHILLVKTDKTSDAHLWLNLTDKIDYVEMISLLHYQNLVSYAH